MKKGKVIKFAQKAVDIEPFIAISQNTKNCKTVLGLSPNTIKYYSKIVFQSDSSAFLLPVISKEAKELIDKKILIRSKFEDIYLLNPSFAIKVSVDI